MNHTELLRVIVEAHDEEQRLRAIMQSKRDANESDFQESKACVEAMRAGWAAIDEARALFALEDDNAPKGFPPVFKDRADYIQWRGRAGDRVGGIVNAASLVNTLYQRLTANSEAGDHARKHFDGSLRSLMKAAAELNPIITELDARIPKRGDRA